MKTVDWEKPQRQSPIVLLIIILEGIKQIWPLILLGLARSFFKNKDEAYVQLCARFAQMNAALVGLCDTFTASQMTHLIDDMFYSEHIFEKLSVYSEYIQTLLQSQQSIRQKELS